MKITGVETWSRSMPLNRPYTIASRTIDAVNLIFVRVRADNGLQGLGSASPAREVTGESFEACSEALETSALEWLKGSDARHLNGLCRRASTSMRETPAARLAVETALHDLYCRHLGLSLVDYFGRCHESLPTSITIGIKPSIEEALEEAEAHVAAGFTCLKIKIGRDLESDLELLVRLRQRHGPALAIRVDANRGYSVEQAASLWPTVHRLGIELVEQPVSVQDFERLSRLPEEQRRIVAADESLIDDDDALALLRSPRPCGIFNIKLMKCGGLTTALTIADLARLGEVDLMWGCMDESVISIAAAIHVALACPRTRFLDLDGSFDLTGDPATGGFRVAEGRLLLTEGLGLGVDLVE